MTAGKNTSASICSVQYATSEAASVFACACVFGVDVQQMFEDKLIPPYSTLSPSLSVSVSSQLGVSFSEDLEYKLNISTLQC